MRLKIILVAGAIVSLMPSAGQAAEILGGAHIHDVKTPLDESGLESGVDISIGYRAHAIGRLLHGELEPYAFVAVNTSGDTSYGALGLSAKFALGRQWYFRPGAGVAIHTGSAGKYFRTDKIAFGSRILFEPEIALGTQLSKRVSVEASWVHMSHAQLAGKENPGIDNIGMRANLAL